MDYSRPTIKRLFALSMNQCAHRFPPKGACEEVLIDPDGMSIMAEICHIQARSPKGPRYNPEMTEEERWGFDNLILMCPNHHKMIDDMYPDRYTVELLHQMKNTSIESGARSRWANENDALIDRAVDRLILIMNRLNLLEPLEPVSMREPVALTITPGEARANFSMGGGITLDSQVTRAAPEVTSVNGGTTEKTPPLRMVQDDSTDVGQGSSS